MLYHDRIKSDNTAGGVDVGVASTSVLAANTSRRYAVFTNDSANVIYLNLGPTAELNKGIRLNPEGGSYEIHFKNFYIGAVSAIATGAGSRLCYVEA